MTDFNLVLSQVRQRLEILYQIVDELEAQGGGGSGGTDDYTQLSNKPQINGHTLTGNKTGSSLGLASTSDLESYLTSNEAAATYQTLAGMSDYLTSSDAASTYQTQAGMSDYLTSSTAASTYQTQSGMSNYYTKTETNSEIASEIVGAINDLDVSAVGGSTKYLTTISEANGLIDASAESPDTVPTTSSDKLITSGGVKTYVDNSATTLSNSIAPAVYGMGQNTYISDETTGIDLNDYTTAGLYIKQYSTNVDTFLNTPFKASGDHYGYTVAAFKLIVEYVNSPNNIRQTLIPLYDSSGYFVRMKTSGVSGTWKAWAFYYGNRAFSEGYGIGASSGNTFDLNDLKTLGRYNYGGTAAPYIDSLPSDVPTNYGGEIIVEANQMNTRFVQTIRINGTPYIGKYWQRYYTYEGWQPWFRFEGTQVITPAANLSSGNELRGASVERGEDIVVEDKGDER